MVNGMRNEPDSHQSTRPRLAREVRQKMTVEPVGEYWNQEDQYVVLLSDDALRESLLERGMSTADVDFNLRVLDIRDIALLNVDLVPLIREKYRCSGIMAVTLGIEEIERYKEQTRQLARAVSHHLDKDALDNLMYLLHTVAGRKYYGDLLREANKVGAVYSESCVEYEGRLFEEPNYELIEARFALDAIWDGEESKRQGATEQNRQLAKKRAPEFHRDPNVVNARRSLGIPRGGFKDPEAALEWAGERMADYSRLDDDSYWKQLVWWESFTCDPDSETVIGRGYIMLNLPKMRDAVQCLVEKYDLGRAWYRALPFYLLRGGLEPPPRIVHQPQRKREKHEQICELWKKYRHDFKVVISYNCGLTDADWAEIGQKEPAANLNRITVDEKARIEDEAYAIAERNGTLRDEKKWINEAYVRRLRSRMRKMGKM